MSIRLILFALLLGAAAVLGVVLYQVSLPAPSAGPVIAANAPPPPPLKVSYLVAARALPAGTLVRDADFTTKAALPTDLPPNAITDSSEARANLRGALVSHYIDAGGMVSLDSVLRPRDRGFLAAVLTPGTRAVSIAVDAVTGVAGLIWPGDRVDVLLTQQMDAAAMPARRVMSRIILQEARVIAVDQQMVQGATGDTGNPGRVARTVTLEVAPEQAETLAVAQRLGLLSLAIRPLQDSPLAGHGTVFGGDVSPELGHGVAASGPSMQMIQGDQRSEVKFR